MSLVNGAEIPKANTKTADISKLLRDHENKQRQLRSDIKVDNMRMNHRDLARCIARILANASVIYSRWLNI